MTAPAMNDGITLGVDLATSRGSLRITFQPGDERAFVVGSSPHADLRLRTPGVGGVVFHLERRQDHVELFPADTTREVLVNGYRVLGPVVLEPTSVVDLPGERLVLTTFDATGHEAATSVRLAEAGIAYVAGLPSENATTLVGVETGGPDSDDAIYEMKTTAFVPESDDDAIYEMKTTAFVPARSPDLERTVSFDGRRTERLPPQQNLGRTLPLGPTGTEVVRRSELYQPAPPPAQVVTDKIPRSALYSPVPAPVAAPVAPIIVPAPIVVPAAAPSTPPAAMTPVSPSIPPESRGPATTRFDHAAPHSAARPAPFVAPVATLGTDTTELDARRLGIASRAPSPQRSSAPPSTWASDNPTVMSPAPQGQRLQAALRRFGRALTRGSRKRPGELVVALGVLARKRPLAVSVGAVTVACALAVAASGAAKLAGYGKATPSRAVAAATAKPKPAPVAPAAPGPTVVPSMVLHLPPQAPLTSASAPAKPRPRGVAFDAEVATAAGDLAAGRDAQARAEYTRLAARSPENPAYESLASLLARAASPECVKAQPGAPSACPEVKR